MYKISIAKPPCTPIREDLTGMGVRENSPDAFFGANIAKIKTFGVLPGGIHCADGYWPDNPGDPVPQRMQADIYVKSPSNAKWTEYLLLRTKRFVLITPPLDPRNTRWALRHEGVMPRGWMDNRDGQCSKAELPKSQGGVAGVHGGQGARLLAGLSNRRGRFRSDLKREQRDKRRAKRSRERKARRRR